MIALREEMMQKIEASVIPLVLSPEIWEQLDQYIEAFFDWIETRPVYEEMSPSEAFHIILMSIRCDWENELHRQCKG